MRRLPMVTVVALAVLTAGCAPRADDPSNAPPATSAPPSTTAMAVVLPADPVPAADGPCPYLDRTFVAQTNGQMVSRVRVSADQPHPACFFYRGNDAEQLRVQVVVSPDAAVARGVVDRVAPVVTSDPATLTGGWDGGKQPTDTGAVFAVAKDGTAVVVITNQKQTIKASRIAEQVITKLGL